MASFMDTILRRARKATSDADLEQLKDEMEGKVPPDLMNENGDDMNGDGDDDKGIHMHVHLPNGNGNGNGDNGDGKDGDLTLKHEGDDPDGGDMNGGGGGDLEARVQALEEQLAQLMDGGEDEVELQNPGDAQDAKRYIMRRGKMLKAHDDETIPVPEREPEIIGETDLPGIEDLDARMSTGDSMRQEVLWQDTMAKGEIIVPGIRIPTFDSKVKMGVTAQRLCSFRRMTLDTALNHEASRTIMADLVGLKTRDQLRKLTCDTLKMAFEATANAMGAERNNNFVRSAVGDTSHVNQPAKPLGALTISEIQRRNREAWATGEFRKPN
jgi:hypothetical protein